MKGRKPYPIELIEHTNDKLRYTKSELQLRKENELKYNGEVIFDCPDHLCDEAKFEWNKIRELYKKLDANILTDLDANALEVYCESVVTYRKAMLKVRETAEVYASKSDPGRPKKNPWLNVASEAAARMKKYSEILLLDPVSRARVGLSKSNDKPATGIAAFMAKRNTG